MFIKGRKTGRFGLGLVAIAASAALALAGCSDPGTEGSADPTATSGGGDAV